MRVVTALLSVSLALLLLAQSSSRKKAARTKPPADTTNADGAVLLGPDPPGRLRPDPPPARDAGIAAASTIDGGADGGTRSLQSLQIEELRARIALLEQQAALQQQQAQQMQLMNEQLSALRQQMADQENRRAQERQQAQQHAEATQSAINSLTYVQQQLMQGDTSVGAALDQAQSAFTGQAQRDIDYARQALRNGDVAGARTYVYSAIMDAQSGR
jgi:hypothetical protein